MSHTTASWSAPDPPIKKRPSALKHTSPWPRGPPGDPGAARECLNGVLAGGYVQYPLRSPLKASRSTCPEGELVASRMDLPSFENSSFVQVGGVEGGESGRRSKVEKGALS